MLEFLERLSGFLAAGGPVLAPIAAVSVLLWGAILQRWLFFRRESRAERREGELWSALEQFVATGDRRELAAACVAGGGVRNRLVKAAVLDLDLPGEGNAELLHVFALRERDRLRSGLGLIAVLTAVAPLLGLLGTVMGMVETFQALTAAGDADPRALSGGISAALLTTQAGLVVALPGLIFGARMERRAEHLEHRLRQFERRAAAALKQLAEQKRP